MHMRKPHPNTRHIEIFNAPHRPNIVGHAMHCIGHITYGSAVQHVICTVIST